MRINLSICLSLTAILLFSCQSERPADTEDMKTRQAVNSGTETGLPSFDNNYLVSVYEAQELVKINHEDAALRKEFCDRALVTDKNLLITMGIAQLINPKTGQPIAMANVERAAKLDAMRWASYGIQWLENNYEPPFGNIRKEFSQPVQIINRATVGDSLFLWIATNYSR